MDFRRVEPRFAKMACLFQLSLLIGLAAYLIFQIIQINSLAEDPPVNSSWKKWNGAGRWAICSNASNELQEAGVGIFNSTGSTFHGTHKLSGWKLSAAEQEMDGVQRHCAIVELSSWTWPQTDTFFNLCGSAPHLVHFYVWSANSWKHVMRAHPGLGIRMQVDKRVQRENDGHTLKSQDYFSTFPLQYFPITLAKSELCPASSWSTFIPTQPETKPAMLQVRISSPSILMTTTQGVMPQLWDLFGKVGGYISLLTLVFNMVFVKMYPDSGVCRIYEARTFIGKPLLGQDKKAKQNQNAPEPLPLPPGMFRDLDTE